MEKREQFLLGQASYCGQERMVLLRMSHDSHIDDDTLELFALGKLTDSEADQIEEHTLACEYCLTRLEQADQFITAFKTAGKRLRSREALRPAPWWRRLGEAMTQTRWQSATILAAAALALVMIGPRLIQQDAPYQDVALRALRGPSEISQLPNPNNRLRLHLDTNGIEPAPALRVSVVSSSGKLLWETQSSTGSGEEIVVALPKPLDPGQYWVRLSNTTPDSPLLREYDLKVHATKQ